VSSLFTFDIYRRYIHPQVSTPSYDRVTLGTYSSVETCL